MLIPTSTEVSEEVEDDTPTSSNAADSWGEHTSEVSVNSGRIDICTAGQLAYVAQEVNSGGTDFATADIYLQNDLNLSAYYWVPIGKYWTGGQYFEGNFYGNGHTILGMKISVNNNIVDEAAGRNYYGLFGVIETTEQHYIGDFTMENSLFEIDSSASFGTFSYIGAVLGVQSVNSSYDSNLTIKNVNLYNTTISYVGDIQYVENFQVGGMVGGGRNLIICNCNNFGGTINIRIETDTSSPYIFGDFNFGGLIGRLRIDEDYSLSDVLGVFSCYNSMDICFTTQNLRNSNLLYMETLAVGGLVGRVSLHSPAGAAGHIFKQPSFKIENSINAGNITFTSEGFPVLSYELKLGTTSAIGGILGSAKNEFRNADAYMFYAKETLIENCCNYGNISFNYLSSGDLSVGGIQGSAGFSTLSKCINFGDIEILVCRNYASYNHSNIFVGGILGVSEREGGAPYNQAYPLECYIDYCFNYGSISCDHTEAGWGAGGYQTTVAGIAGGILQIGSVEGSFNYGKVSSYTNAAGIIGYCGWDHDGVTVTGNVSFGEVDGIQSSNGLVYKNWGTIDKNIVYFEDDIMNQFSENNGSITNVSLISTLFDYYGSSNGTLEEIGISNIIAPEDINSENVDSSTEKLVRLSKNNFPEVTTRDTNNYFIVPQWIVELSPISIELEGGTNIASNFNVTVENALLLEGEDDSGDLEYEILHFKGTNTIYEENYSSNISLSDESHIYNFLNFEFTGEPISQTFEGEGYKLEQETSLISVCFESQIYDVGFEFTFGYKGADFGNVNFMILENEISPGTFFEVPKGKISQVADLLTGTENEDGELFDGDGNIQLQIQNYKFDIRPKPGYAFYQIVTGVADSDISAGETLYYNSSGQTINYANLGNVTVTSGIAGNLDPTHTQIWFVFVSVVYDLQVKIGDDEPLDFANVVNTRVYERVDGEEELLPSEMSVELNCFAGSVYMQGRRTGDERNNISNWLGMITESEYYTCGYKISINLVVNGDNKGEILAFESLTNTLSNDLSNYSIISFWDDIATKLSNTDDVFTLEYEATPIDYTFDVQEFYDTASSFGSFMPGEMGGTAWMSGGTLSDGKTVYNLDNTDVIGNILSYEEAVGYYLYAALGLSCGDNDFVSDLNLGSNAINMTFKDFLNAYYEYIFTSGMEEFSLEYDENAEYFNINMSVFFKLAKVKVDVENEDGTSILEETFPTVNVNGVRSEVVDGESVSYIYLVQDILNLSVVENLPNFLGFYLKNGDDLLFLSNNVSEEFSFGDSDEDFSMEINVDENGYITSATVNGSKAVLNDGVLIIVPKFMESQSGSQISAINGIYEVWNATDLLWISSQTYIGNSFEGYVIRLMDDIDMSEVTSWRPIGSQYIETFSAVPFSGVFDGNNHIIYNLSFDEVAKSNVGLFGWTDGAIIKNLTLFGGTINGFGEVGTVVGYAEDTSFTNVNNYSCSLDITDFEIYDIYGQKLESESLRTNFGELVGYATGCSFVGCSNRVTIPLSDVVVEIGGLIGYASNCDIDQCYTNSGRLVEQNSGSQMTNYYDATSQIVSNSSLWITVNGRRVLKIFYW